MEELKTDISSAEVTEDSMEENAKPKSTKFWYILVPLIILLTGLLMVWNLCQAPLLPEEKKVKIEEGSSIRSIALQMKNEGLTKSDTALYLIILYLHRDEPIKAGTFTFTEPLNAFDLASYLITTIPRDDLVRVTFPEGMKAREYANIANSALENISAEEFNKLAVNREGYLWPETYFVPEDYTTEQLIDLMLKENTKFIDSKAAEIENNQLTQNEILTLASIVEAEANDETSMKMVAGILLNRIDIGMPLQADATIEYILDTEIGEMKPGELAEKLKEIDSPYNTYLYKGLPPTPIGNPGAQAIDAVLNPTPSEFLFYITGNDGVFYYAETFEEHQRNISLHL